MAKLSILFGALLIVLGVAGYILQGETKSPTAFIPAGFGLLLVIPGLIAAAKPGLNKHAMHVSALVALLGTLGGLGMSVPKLLSGEPLARPLAVGSQAILGVLCLIFLVLCVRSFIAARRNRLA